MSIITYKEILKKNFKELIQKRKSENFTNFNKFFIRLKHSYEIEKNLNENNEKELNLIYQIENIKNLQKKLITSKNFFKKEKGQNDIQSNDDVLFL